jgi:hypothetical protein
MGPGDGEAGGGPLFIGRVEVSHLRYCSKSAMVVGDAVVVVAIGAPCVVEPAKVPIP